MQEEKIHFHFLINGYEVEASYTRALIEEVLLPFFRSLSKQAQITKKRMLIFLGAPCGAGKSTLAAMIEQLPKFDEEILEIQALGMDGFHHRQAYILSHSIFRDGKHIPMKQVKGCPETFDFEKLYQKVVAIKTKDDIWPIYDRTLHDVQEEGIHVHAPLVLIEGNYLLLDEAPWNQLQPLCDASIFIEAEIEEIKGRLIKRKMMGGLSPHEALAFCENSDLRNAQRTLTYRLPADLTLRLERQTLQKK